MNNTSDDGIASGTQGSAPLPETELETAGSGGGAVVGALAGALTGALADALTVVLGGTLTGMLTGVAAGIVAGFVAVDAAAGDGAVETTGDVAEVVIGTLVVIGAGGCVPTAGAVVVAGGDAEVSSALGDVAAAGADAAVGADAAAVDAVDATGVEAVVSAKLLEPQPPSAENKKTQDAKADAASVFAWNVIACSSR